MENEIFAVLARYQFTPVNQNICVGTWKNYAVALRRQGGSVYCCYLAVRLEKERRSGLKKELNSAIKQSGSKKAGSVTQVSANFLIYTFTFPKQEDPAVFFSDRMNFITDALRNAGVAPADTCAVTGASGPDSLCLISSPSHFGYQPVFATAVRQNDAKIQARAEENETNGSYLGGIIGALLGTLLGIGINLLTIVFLKRIYVVLFALIPIAAMFGYKLLRGKTNWFAIVVVFTLSLIAIPVLELLSLALSFVREFDLPFGESLSYFAKHFFDGEILKETGPEMLKFLLFTALGLFASWSYVHNSLNSSQLAGAKLQLDTMRPNPNRQ